MAADQDDTERCKIKQYEDYRQFFLEGDTASHPDGGIALLLRKGMQNWYLAPIQSATASSKIYNPTVGRTNTGLDFKGELTRILGNLTIDAMGGI